jgi:hypothetical protein
MACFVMLLIKIVVKQDLLYLHRPRIIIVEVATSSSALLGLRRQSMVFIRGCCGDGFVGAIVVAFLVHRVTARIGLFEIEYLQRIIGHVSILTSLLDAGRDSP